MGLFSRFAKKNTASLAYRRQMAQMISNKRIKYVGERRDGVEEVIGKGGSISIRDDEILVFSSADVLLRRKLPIWTHPSCSLRTASSSPHPTWNTAARCVP